MASSTSSLDGDALHQPSIQEHGAINLYVTSYAGGDGSTTGNITTVSLTQKPDSTFSLSQLSTLNTGTNSPSWITLDRQNGILYLVDEAINLATNGTVVAYKTSPGGKLTEISRKKALVGGVDATFFASGSALAIAHYSGSSLQTYNLDSKGQIELLETLLFMSSNYRPGPISSHQESPHPHQTILDPTQSYLLVPDLGSDEVRIFSIDPTSRKLTAKEPLKTKPGTGPRHGIFSLNKIAGSYLFYLVGELIGDVTAYRVTYKSDLGGMSFDKIASYGVLKPGSSLPKRIDGSSQVAPAEIAITPDGSTLIISNRNDTSFGKMPPTDSLASYSISPVDGSLKQLPLVSAHGSFPRHFAINKVGTLMAVGLQESGTLVILRRNSSSVLFDEEVASIKFSKGADMPVCLVWDE